MKQEDARIIEYLNNKYEALDFWESLKNCVPVENKIKKLQEEINEGKLILMNRSDCNGYK